MDKTKKIASSLATFALITLPLFALAQNYQGASEPGGNSSASIDNIVGNIVDKIWVVFAALAVILFVWAGVTFLTANGAPEKIQQARTAALWGVVGVVVMILAFSIFSIANSILGS